MAAFVLCIPAFSGAQIGSTEHRQAQTSPDGRWVETAAAISPALDYSANLPMQQCLHSTAFDPGIAAGFTGVPLLIDCITPARAEAALTLGGYDRVLIQQCLHNSGFDPGSDDGLFDHQTRQALLRWQARHQYPQTGYVADLYQQAMLINCLTPARMVQTAQTEWTDSPERWLAKSQVALESVIAAEGLKGWLLALYIGLGVVGAAVLSSSGGGDDPAPPAVVTPPAPPPVVRFINALYAGGGGGYHREPCVPVTATDPNGARLAYSLVQRPQLPAPSALTPTPASCQWRVGYHTGCRNQLHVLRHCHQPDRPQLATRVTVIHHSCVTVIATGLGFKQPVEPYTECHRRTESDRTDRDGYRALQQPAQCYPRQPNSTGQGVTVTNGRVTCVEAA